MHVRRQWHVSNECGAVGKGIQYSRLDIDVRWSPPSDEAVTILHRQDIPRLLVSQPCIERATVAKRTAIKGE